LRFKEGKGQYPVVLVRREERKGKGIGKKGRIRGRKERGGAITA